MRKLYKMNLSGMPPSVVAAFNEIYNASQEADIIDIASPYTITGTYTQTRNLNVTSPTTANIAAVLATLLSDLKKGGATKTT